MPYLVPLQRLTKLFQEINSKWQVCEDPDERKELLRQMKDVINEADELIEAHILHSPPHPSSE